MFPSAYASLDTREFKDFIRENISNDPATLALKGQVPLLWIQQLEVRQRLSNKYSELSEDLHLIMPGKVNVEQASSLETAEFKSSLFQGERAADLTGGMGLDTLFFAGSFKEMHYLEKDPELFEVSRHNLNHLNPEIHTHLGDGIEFLEESSFPFDLVYVDPARRDSGNKKVFLFRDCQPDVTKFRDLFKRKATHTLIKAAPILDIKRGIQELGGVSNVWVIALRGEVKEVLFHMGESDTMDPPIHCVELKQSGTHIFTFSDRIGEVRLTSELDNYLLEPLPSIMKAGMWDHIAENPGVAKLHPNTHLFTSDRVPEGVPAHVYRIIEVLPYSKKARLPQKANVKVRNARIKPKEVEKRWNVQPGGDEFLFVATLNNGKQVFIRTQPELLFH